MPVEGVVVLVVDDEAKIRENLADFFEDYGFAVLSAASAEEGLETLGRHQVHCCTVDMRLPGMNGNDFILKAHAAYPDLKFLIYTGTPEYYIPPALKKLGVTGAHVIKKPVPDMEILAKSIQILVDGGTLVDPCL